METLSAHADVAMRGLLDKKAKDILFKTYWSGAGWRDKPYTSPDDLAYAKAKGLMFDPASFSHDACVDDILALRERLPPASAARIYFGAYL